MSELIDRLREAAKAPAIHQSIAAVLLEAAAEIEDEERLLELRWAADMRAIKRWQEAHPDKVRIWPDHADLVVWLMEGL